MPRDSRKSTADQFEPNKTMKEIISSIELFRNVAPTTIDILSSCAFQKQLSKGEYLFFDKDPILFVYIVVTGMVSLFKTNSLAEKKVIFVLGSGKLLNEIALQELPCSINCEVIEDSLILGIPKDKLLYFMERDFHLTKSIMDSMAIKIRQLYRQLKNTTNSLRGDKKIAAKLWKLSREHGIPCEEGTKIFMELSITYLADMMGSKRETVSRHLKLLVEQNLVIVRRNCFIIPDPDKLREYFKQT